MANENSGLTCFLTGATIGIVTTLVAGPILGPAIIISASLAAKKMAEAWDGQYRKEIANWINANYEEGTTIYEVLFTVHHWVDNGMACILQISGKSESGDFVEGPTVTLPREEAMKMGRVKVGDTLVYHLRG